MKIANMNTFLYYVIISWIVIMFAFALNSMEKRDQAMAKYWEQRQSECRSMGINWDLNNKGECVQFEMY